MFNKLQQHRSTPAQRDMKIIALYFALCAIPILSSEVNAMPKPKHIVLLGASVGKAWDVESLPNRLMKKSSSHLAAEASGLTLIKDYRFEFVGEYQFDKSKALQQIVQRENNKPEAIVIKECATYFPGDLPKYQELMRGWVAQCKQAGVIPIPATVVPVVKDESLIISLKDMVKRILGRPTNTSRLNAVLQYSDWVKLYSEKEGLLVLDLEAPLRISLQDRSLRLDLHSGDGLHLNERAYRLLDQIVLPTLDRQFQKNRFERS